MNEEAPEDKAVQKPPDTERVNEVLSVVLISGKGTRLCPFTYAMPKSMVLMRNRPCILYMVDSLKAAGPVRAVLSIPHTPSNLSRARCQR